VKIGHSVGVNDAKDQERDLLGDVGQCSRTNPPALNTNHTPGKAIDMDITWTGTIKIKKKDGTEESVAFMADVNKNTKLHTVGASYEVKKLTTDAPHWSHDGH